MIKAGPYLFAPEHVAGVQKGNGYVLVYLVGGAEPVEIHYEPAPVLWDWFLQRARDLMPPAPKDAPAPEPVSVPAPGAKVFLVGRPDDAPEPDAAA